ncbi:MAG: hypothetical protein JW927_07825 [Deltaproteobacteria bacterium]|nr:hypothetical protein [Deltaproteobacteria bacterium]
MAINRTVTEPVTPSIGKTLFVSLTTMPDTAHEELEIEKVTVTPAADPPLQQYQTVSRPARSVERERETGMFVTSKAQAIPASGVHEGYTFTNDITLSSESESPYGMEWDFGNIPEFKAEGIETSIGKEVPGSGTPGGNSLAPYLTPSYGLDAVNRFEQAFGEMAEAEIERKRIEWRINYLKKYEALMPPDCITYYGSAGLFAIPFIIKDAITHNNKVCMW